jgi:(2Fe-2S) ferredoxin
LGDDGKVYLPAHHLEPHESLLLNTCIRKMKSLINDTMPCAPRNDIDEVTISETDYAQQNTDTLDISATLSKADFRRIVQFVLTEGDRVTYSQQYNYSPHYAADGFEIFLDPAGQHVKYENDLSYYTHITIRTPEPRTYYDFIELFNDGKVYIFTHPLEPHEGFENLLLNVYIPKIKSLIADTMSRAPRKDVDEVTTIVETDSTQQNTDIIKLDISATLSKADFRRIVQFVLTEGDRVTYSNKYNNNPHYRTNDFEIFLNPVNQRINWWYDDLSVNVFDYNVIVLRTNEPRIYYDNILLGDDGKVYIYTHKLEPHEGFENLLLDVYIPKLKSLIVDVTAISETDSVQQKTDKLDNSAALSKEDFRKIVQFVLSEGDRQTYCNMYNDNPHYKTNDFEIYINPVNQNINPLSVNVLDYNEIVFEATEPELCYCDIRLGDDGKVHIATLRKGFKNIFRDVYIPKLKSLINNK